ncbi:MAG TPA: hypothetical protein VH815_06515 [Acidobacteriota bacterium]|jgi:hypothetical protein
MSRKKTEIIAKYEEPGPPRAAVVEQAQLENSNFRDDQLESMIDQTLADSFPASDPPAWTLGRDQD